MLVLGAGELLSVPRGALEEHREKERAEDRPAVVKEEVGWSGHERFSRGMKAVIILLWGTGSLTG